jgi:hypothetical protein
MHSSTIFLVRSIHNGFLNFYLKQGTKATLSILASHFSKTLQPHLSKFVLYSIKILFLIILMHLLLKRDTTLWLFDLRKFYCDFDIGMNTENPIRRESDHII